MAGFWGPSASCAASARHIDSNEITCVKRTLLRLLALLGLRLALLPRVPLLLQRLLVGHQRVHARGRGGRRRIPALCECGRSMPSAHVGWQRICASVGSPMLNAARCDGRQRDLRPTRVVAKLAGQQHNPIRARRRLGMALHGQHVDRISSSHVVGEMVVPRANIADFDRAWLLRQIALSAANKALPSVTRIPDWSA